MNSNMIRIGLAIAVIGGNLFLGFFQPECDQKVSILSFNCACLAIGWASEYFIVEQKDD